MFHMPVFWANSRDGTAKVVVLVRPIALDARLVADLGNSGKHRPVHEASAFRGE